jgi:hypothetical protein
MDLDFVLWGAICISQERSNPRQYIQITQWRRENLWKIYNTRANQTVASKSVEQNRGSKLGQAKNRSVKEYQKSRIGKDEDEWVQRKREQRGRRRIEKEGINSIEEGRKQMGGKRKGGNSRGEEEGRKQLGGRGRDEAAGEKRKGGSSCGKRKGGSIWG